MKKTHLRKSAPLTHLDSKGQARMVDVSHKPETQREAIAQGCIYMKKKTLKLITDRKITKGDVLGVSRIAGIMAAKKTSEIIPLCHPLKLSSIEIDFSINKTLGKITVMACVKNTGQTGVEMEALTAVCIAALTIYDMCKAVDRGITITDIMLLEKRGGKSGEWKRKP
jgi:cyclic pyranopterin phosphate synthase